MTGGLFGVLLGSGLSASGTENGGAIGAPARSNWGGVWGGGTMTASSRRVTPDIALTLSTVYGAVNLLAKTIGALPLSIYRRDRDGKLFEAPEHPISDVLGRTPNTWQTAFDFKSMMMAHLALRGNAFAEILPGPRGAVDRLEPLHPDRVSVDRLEDGTLRYTVAEPTPPGVPRAAQQVRYLLQDEVFHIRSPMAAANGLVGVSPVTYARETIGLSLAAEETGARLFNNGMRPSGVIQFPKGSKLGDAAFDRLKADLRSSFGGMAKAGGTPILEDGGEFKAISLTADDAQFLGTRDFQIEEICRWFDTPPVLLHHTTKTTSWGTGVEAIMIAFVRNNLKPWLSAWTDATGRDLILAPGIYSARFDTEDLQRGDSAAMANFYSRLVLNGVLTRNEARQALGYNPLDGLDEPLVPINTTTPDNMPQHVAPSALEGPTP